MQLSQQDLDPPYRSSNAEIFSNTALEVIFTVQLKTEGRGLSLQYFCHSKTTTLFSSLFVVATVF